MIFVSISQTEFEKQETNFPNSNYYQTVKWGKLKKLTGWTSHYVGIKDHDQYLALALILSKKVIGQKQIFYAPRGFLMNYQDFTLLAYFTKEIKKYVKEHQGFMFKIDPCLIYKTRDKDGNELTTTNAELIQELKKLGYYHQGFTRGYTKEAQYRWSYYLDTTVSLDTLLKNMDKRCRRCLRKSENYPLVIKEVTTTNINDFENIMDHTSFRQKHFNRSLVYYHRLKELFGNRLLMLVIYLDKDKYLSKFPAEKTALQVQKEPTNLIPISAGVFIKDQNMLHYVYGGTYLHYMSLMAQYKMQFAMIKYAKDQNLTIYDFGGISGDFNQGSPNYGVYEFKRGFGGYIVEYIGEFDLIIDKKIYYLYSFMFSFYRRLKKILASLLSKKKIY